MLLQTELVYTDNLNVGLNLCPVTRQTLQELFYFHKDLNIIHDNLKCFEVIITLDGDVKIGNSPSSECIT